ncbi:MAG: zinc ribbon domain-containing protein [Chloroflexi bacterium]|nr:zinc ribbon domain-containing protein [Chloroflexota bacterium]
MPVYDYECEHCGTHFERLQSFTEEPVRQCPECSGSVHKVFHPAGIIFKGSGWYITDSRKSSSSTVTAEKKTNGAESKDDQKTASTETKTAAPAESKTETAKAEPAKAEAQVKSK